MGMLDYLNDTPNRGENSIVSVGYAYTLHNKQDYNAAYNGEIAYCWRDEPLDKLIAHSIAMEIGIQHTSRMTPEQWETWYNYLFDILNERLSYCRETIGSNFGYSYNASLNTTCRMYHSRIGIPVVKAWHKGIIAIALDNKILAIFPDGRMVRK